MENPLLPDSAIERYKIKFGHIMPTLVSITIGTVAILSLVHWIVLEFDVAISKEVFDMWIPIFGPWIPVLIWLRPKQRILTNKDPDKLNYGYQMIAWFVIGVPCLISQFYVSSATGSLATVQNADALRTQPLSRYYKVTDFEVDTVWIALGEDIRTSGKYNDRLHINFYFVLPIVNVSEAFDSTKNPVFWYGVQYRNEIKNNLSDEEKEAKYQEFYKESIDSIRSYDFQDLTYFERTLPSGDLDVFRHAVARINPGLKNTAVILEPVDEPFEARTGNTLPWIFGSMIIGFAVYAMFLSFVRYDPTELNNQRTRNKSTKKDDIIEVLQYLIPRHPHFVSSIILDLNIVVMLLMLLSGVHPISPNGIELMEWGANRRAEVLDGQWWRLFTSMFVHGGIVHLLFNLYGLYVASIFIEKLLKPGRFATVYLLSGLAGSIASIVFKENPSVGASGAIFGLFGANLALLLTEHYPKQMRSAILAMLGPYIGLNLLFGFVIPGVDNAAHIGGLIAGFVIGFVFLKTMKVEEVTE